MRIIKRYGGWIPTVLGKLSFTKIGSSYRNNYGIAIISNGIIKTSDGLFSNILKYFSYKKPKAALYILLATSRGGLSNVGALEGVVYLYPARYSSPFVLGATCKRFALYAFDGERKLREGHFNADEHIKLVEEIITDLYNLDLCASGDFTLKRNGEFYLTVTDGYIEKYKYDDVLTIAKQMYNSVRNSVHTHKHHKDSVDNIITIHEIENCSDSSWKPQVQYSLVRRVIDKHAEKNELAQSEALGVSAYLKAFDDSVYKSDKIRDKEKYLTDGSLKYPLINNLDKSIEASIKRGAVYRSLHAVAASVILAYIAVLAVLKQINYIGDRLFVILLIFVIVSWLVFWYRHLVSIWLRFYEKIASYRLLIFMAFLFFVISILILIREYLPL